MVEAEVDRQDRQDHQDHQDHQEDHRRRQRDYLQGLERKDCMIGMRELTRSYWNDR